MNRDRQPDSIGNATTFRGAFRDIQIGVSIGPNDRYEIRDNLGRGGMGEVFLAYDRLGGIEVAVKLIPREVSASEEEMQQIRKNFALVQKLHHSNIAAVTNLERLPDSGEYFLVMEAVPGRNTLHKERLNREGEKIPVEEAIRICKQVAEALDYAHGQKVLHRDIKPANVMLTPSGEVKLTDFGLAAQIVSSMHRVSMMPVNTSGTRPYMAPEQWESRLQDERTDQWALAVMFYELVSGWVPFSSNDVEILERQVLTKTPRRPDELSEPQWAALIKALGKNKEDRFSSCAEFISALSPAQAGPKRKRSFVPKLLAATCIAGLLGGVAYLYIQKGSQGDSEPSRTNQVDKPSRQEAEARKALEAQLKEAKREKQAATLALEQKRKEEAAARATAERKAEQEARARILAEQQLAEQTALQNQTTRTVENFSDNSRGWSLRNTAEVELAVRNGHYYFSHKRDARSWVCWERSIAVPERSDFTIRCTAKHVSGIMNNGYGLIFGSKGAEDCYYFQVNGLGSYKFIKWVDGESQPVVDWTRSKAVNKGNAKNQLEIQKRGARARLVVNGEKVDEAPCFDFPGQWVGFRVDKRQEIEFDDLVVEIDRLQ